MIMKNILSFALLILKLLCFIHGDVLVHESIHLLVNVLTQLPSHLTSVTANQEYHKYQKANNNGNNDFPRSLRLTDIK